MRRGAVLEVMLNHQHHLYRSTRRAKVEKTYPEVKVGPGGKALFTAKGPADYYGIVKGRPIAFDAKQSGRPILRLDLIPNHQAIDLEMTDMMGGFAFLVVQLEARQFVLPWSQLAETYWSATKGVPLDWVEKRGREIFNGDWLPAVENML